MKLNFQFSIFSLSKYIENLPCLNIHFVKFHYEGRSCKDLKQPEKILKSIVTSNKFHNIAVFLKDFSDMHASVDDGLCMHVLSDKRAT